MIMLNLDDWRGNEQLVQWLAGVQAQGQSDLLLGVMERCHPRHAWNQEKNETSDRLLGRIEGYDQALHYLRVAGLPLADPKPLESTFEEQETP